MNLHFFCHYRLLLKKNDFIFFLVCYTCYLHNIHIITMEAELIIEEDKKIVEVMENTKIVEVMENTKIVEDVKNNKDEEEKKVVEDIAEKKVEEVNKEGSVIIEVSIKEINWEGKSYIDTIIFHALKIPVKCVKVSYLIAKIQKHVAVSNEEKKSHYVSRLKTLLKKIFVDVVFDESMDIIDIVKMLFKKTKFEIRATPDCYGDYAELIPYLENSFQYLKDYSIGRMITSINYVSLEKNRLIKYAITYSNGIKKYFLFDDGNNGYYAGWLEIHDPTYVIKRTPLDNKIIRKNQMVAVLGLPGSGKSDFLKTIMLLGKNNVLDDYVLDDLLIDRIHTLIMNGEQVIICNSLFCNPEYLEYFLSSIGVINMDLIKFIFFVPNPYQSSLNIKQRETDEVKQKSFLISLKNLSSIYNISSMHEIKEKYCSENYCFIKTYSPEKVESEIEIETKKELLYFNVKKPLKTI